MARKQPQKRRSKAATAAAMGAAGLGLSLAGSASASSLPAANAPQLDNNLTSQRFVLGEEEMADVGLATFHLFDREQGTSGMDQVAWGCRGCRGCRGCAARGCRGCGGCGGGCCASWGRCRLC
jgi:hypothetical protein